MRELTVPVCLGREFVGAELAGKLAWVDTTPLCFQRSGWRANYGADDHGVEDPLCRLRIIERGKRRVVGSNRPHGSVGRHVGSGHPRGMIALRYLAQLRSNPRRI